MDDLRDRITTAQRHLAARLTLRHALRGGGRGLVLGVAAAAVLTLLLGQLAPGASILAIAAALCVAIATAAGASTALWRRPLARDELAQLTDRMLGTDEAWVTATWLASRDDDPSTARHRARLRALLLDAAPARVVPLTWPRALRQLPLALFALIGASLVPPLTGAGQPTPPASDAEGARLERRLRQLDQELQGTPLPEDVRVALEQLPDALDATDVEPQDAAERIEAIQQRLRDEERRLAPSHDALDALEQAADALSRHPDAAEALRDGDLAGAADALEQAQQQAQTPEQQAQLGEDLQRAAEALREGGDATSQLADPMDALGRELADGAEASGAAGDGARGASDAAQRRQQALRDELERNRALGERLADDTRALERARRTNGALEAAKQRLQRRDAQPPQDPAGASGAGDDAGQRAGQAEGAEGQQQGSTQAGAGGDGDGAGDGDAGRRVSAAGHTWEDEGARQGGPAAEGFQDQDRTSDRRGSADQHIDDFERLYAPARLDDVDALLAGVDGQVHEQGQIDVLTTRRTGSDEQATRPLLDLPPRYADAARDALQDEAVPAGYREAVKRYFDDVE